MEHLNEHAKDGIAGTEQVSSDQTGGTEAVGRVIELARAVRLAQRTAAEFLRRWAVEQAVEDVGLVALRSAMIDLPSTRWMGQLESQSINES